MSFNKIIVVGNLGGDPELNYTPQGLAVCHFSVATNEKKRDKAGEMQESATWFRITAWGKQAENASKYLSKGRPVYVEGRLRIEEYTDKSGKTRFSLEVSASDIQFLGSRDSEADSEGETGANGGDTDRPNQRSAAKAHAAGAGRNGGNNFAASEDARWQNELGEDDSDEFNRSRSLPSDDDIPF